MISYQNLPVISNVWCSKATFSIVEIVILVLLTHFRIMFKLHFRINIGPILPAVVAGILVLISSRIRYGYLQPAIGTVLGDFM